MDGFKGGDTFFLLLFLKAVTRILLRLRIVQGGQIRLDGNWLLSVVQRWSSRGYQNIMPARVITMTRGVIKDIKSGRRRARERGCGYLQHVSCWKRLPRTQGFLTQESPGGWIHGHADRPSISKAN